MSNSLFQNVHIETGGLIVRPFVVEDAGALQSILCQPNVLAFLPEDIMTLDEVLELLTWLHACYRENTAEKILKWTLAIVCKKTSQVIGWCGIGPLDFNPDENELFCGLSESHWGKGIAADACRALLDYAFDVIGLTRVVAVVNPENRQSMRLVQKLGMRPGPRVIGLPEEHRHYEGFLYYSISK